jgi:hypothetical protein
MLNYGRKYEMNELHDVPVGTIMALVHCELDRVQPKVHIVSSSRFVVFERTAELERFARDNNALIGIRSIKGIDPVCDHHEIQYRYIEEQA